MFPATVTVPGYFTCPEKGFTVRGRSETGYSVSNGGDINGDGITDLVVGARGAGANEAYVIYGRPNGTPFPATINAPADLTGTAVGFTVQGGIETGWSVSNGGDINGDGITDLVVGAPAARAPGAPGANEAYVIYGRPMGTPFPATISAPTDLTGTAVGFTVQGVTETGYSVSTGGDINGDGIADLLVGAHSARRAYVIYGRPNGTPFPATINALTDLTGTTVGFTVQGNAATGSSVSNGGDINGDGITDLLVGTSGSGASEAYVIYGRPMGTPFPATITAPAALTGTAVGFTVQGGSNTGFSVSNGGDINGDGITDLLAGAYGAAQAYVIYGRPNGTTFPATITAPGALTGTAVGFTVQGLGNAGRSVSNGGDINGDGITDLLVGADSSLNRVYVIYGRPNGTAFPATITAPGALTGTAVGFTVQGGSGTGRSVSNGGDINGDGITDLLVGAVTAQQAYVIFGGPPACPSPSPSQSPSASVSPSDSISPSPSLSPSASVSSSPSVSPSASISPSPSPSGSPSESISQANLASLGVLTELSAQIVGSNQMLVSNAALLTGNNNAITSPGQQAPYTYLNSGMLAYNSQPVNPFLTTTTVLGMPTGGISTHINTATGGTTPIGTVTTATTTLGGGVGTTGNTITGGILPGTQTIVCQEILSTASISPSKTLTATLKPEKSKKKSPKPGKTKGKKLQARAVKEKKPGDPNLIKVVIKDGKVLSTTGEEIPKGLVGKIVKKVNKKGKTKFKVQIVKKDPVTGQKTPLQQYQCTQTPDGQPQVSSSPTPSTTPVCRKIIQIKKYDAATRKYKLIKTKEVEGGSITVDAKGKNVIESKSLKNGGLKVLIQKPNGKRKIIKDFACRQVVKKDPPIQKGKVKRFDLSLLKDGGLEGSGTKHKIRSADDSVASTAQSVWMKPLGMAADILTAGRQSFLGNQGIEQAAMHESRWNDGSLLHSAQLPLVQTGMHLIQQGYNHVMDWFQSKGSDDSIQIQELVPAGQVAGFLREYDRASKELEGILQQLESENAASSSMLGWLKDSVVEHRVQRQQLVQQSMVAQESIKTYLENIQAVAQDVTELVETLAADSSNSAVSYAKVRLANVNQLLSMLSEDPVIVAKDQGTLRANVRAQIQTNTLQQQPLNLIQPPTAINASTQLTADVMGLLV
jgi:hypothetical protein